MLPPLDLEAVRPIDHKQRQVRRIGDPGGGDMHKVFQPPGLFGVPKVKLDLAPSAVVVHEGSRGPWQITAEQDSMRLGLGTQIGLDHDDDIQRMRELFVEQLGLI